MFRKKLSKEDFLEASVMFWCKTLSKRKRGWYSDHVAFRTDGFTVYDDDSSENLEKVISEVKTNVYHNDDVKIRIVKCDRGFTGMDEIERREYQWLLRVTNPEVYHDFLEKSVNSHAIGDEFYVLHDGGIEENYWDLAEYENYIEIPYVNGTDTFKVKILKHWEE